MVYSGVIINIETQICDNNILTTPHVIILISKFEDNNSILVVKWPHMEKSKTWDKWEIEISICNAINVLDAAFSFKVFHTMFSYIMSLLCFEKLFNKLINEIKIEDLLENIKLFQTLLCYYILCDRKSKANYNRKRNVLFLSVLKWYWLLVTAKYVENWYGKIVKTIFNLTFC